MSAGEKLRPVVPIALLTLLLLVPAVHNGFPLIFPDSGTYLGIAFGPEYALDRSSYYGLLLKPLVALGPGVIGLWIAVAVQALAVALVLWAVAGALDAEGSGRWRRLAWIAPAALLTALPWHSGQLMPDALTGMLVLLVWLAASRAPGRSGNLLLWTAIVVAALTHYTHLPLLLAAAAATLLSTRAAGRGWRLGLRRWLPALAAAGLVLAGWIVANGAVLGRWTVSPTGSVFLYARLNEDGLIGPWLDRHCGRDAPPRLCAIRGQLPRDSQQLLWTGAATPVTDLIWHPDPPEARWLWVDMMAQANRGAIAERPGQFLLSSLRGFARQLVSFAPLDDECPNSCRDPSGGITYILGRYRPETVPALLASHQSQGTTPKALVRNIVMPVAILALLLLPVALVLAWRRRDGPALSLAAAVTAALLVNAALAGALSDVHDRYQSRLVWLAPFALLMIAWRWRRLTLPGAHPYVRGAPDKHGDHSSAG
ncbi:MAG TPA: hypothetical protein VMS43_08845 [Allosphingosinicella sp.]|nr:hypothetical protein [Allosphingosinicella sp.]